MPRRLQLKVGDVLLHRPLHHVLWCLRHPRTPTGKEVAALGFLWLVVLCASARLASMRSMLKWWSLAALVTCLYVRRFPDRPWEKVLLLAHAISVAWMGFATHAMLYIGTDDQDTQIVVHTRGHRLCLDRIHDTAEKEGEENHPIAAHLPRPWPDGMLQTLLVARPMAASNLCLRRDHAKRISGWVLSDEGHLDRLFAWTMVWYRWFGAIGPFQAQRASSFGSGRIWTSCEALCLAWHDPRSADSSDLAWKVFARHPRGIVANDFTRCPSWFRIIHPIGFLPESGGL